MVVFIAVPHLRLVKSSKYCSFQNVETVDTAKQIVRTNLNIAKRIDNGFYDNTSKRFW